MKLIKDYTENSAYSFLENENTALCKKVRKLCDNDDMFFEKVDELINDYGCDEILINEELKKQYPEDKYFVLVDYIDDKSSYFHIRIWEK